MADWDEDSPRLQRNLKTLLLSARKQTTRREPITLDQIKAWHREMLFGLTSPNPEWVGTFRGELGLETIEVKIGNHFGVSAGEVATTLVLSHRPALDYDRHPDLNNKPYPCCLSKVVISPKQLF